MSHWVCAQLLPHKAALALHCLAAAGYATYYPRLREQRRSHGRRIEARPPPLFLNYAFVQIELQWYAARWAPGVCRLVTAGDGHPAIVPEVIISEIKARECNGLVELPKPPLALGAKVRVVAGPLSGIEGLYAGMKPRARVEVLLALFGGQQRVTLPTHDIEPA
jgi:transcription antitermination factor NusG